MLKACFGLLCRGGPSITPVCVRLIDWRFSEGRGAISPALLRSSPLTAHWRQLVLITKAPLVCMYLFFFVPPIYILGRLVWEKEQPRLVRTPLVGCSSGSPRGMLLLRLVNGTNGCVCRYRV